MGKKAKARRESTAKPAARGPELRTSPNWPLLAVSVLGMALTGYMTWTALDGGSVRGCSVGSSCDVVLHSEWATLMGIPTSMWGLLTYALLAGISFIKRVDRHWQTAWPLALFGVVYSLYLTTVSLTILHAACPYCLTSLALMTTIFVLTTTQRPKSLVNFSWQRWLGRTVPAAAAIIVVLHLNYTGVIGTPRPPDNPIARPLAEHLTSVGARFYGASWCPHCKEQKAMFGSAARFLPYIECSPHGGQGTPEAPECIKENIGTYPTWIVNGKRMEEVLSLKELSEASGFTPPAPPPAAN